LKNSPFYIAGESFAGHYIPNLANKILFNSTFTSETGMQFKGVMIGNGWVDPINQINYYDSYLWSVGIIENTFKEVCIWYQTNSIVHIYRS
jgi:serine carboxypeptidase-like clade 2